MKIGVSSYSFSKYMHQTGADYFAVCDLAKKMGYDAIEFIDLSLDVQPAACLTDLSASPAAASDHSVLLPERFSGSSSALHLRYSLLSFSRATSVFSPRPIPGA